MVSLLVAEKRTLILNFFPSHLMSPSKSKALLGRQLLLLCSCATWCFFFARKEGYSVIFKMEAIFSPLQAEGIQNFLQAGGSPPLHSVPGVSRGEKGGTSVLRHCQMSNKCGFVLASNLELYWKSNAQVACLLSSQLTDSVLENNHIFHPDKLITIVEETLSPFFSLCEH